MPQYGPKSSRTYCVKFRITYFSSAAHCSTVERKLSCVCQAVCQRNVRMRKNGEISHSLSLGHSLASLISLKVHPGVSRLLCHFHIYPQYYFDASMLCQCVVFCHPKHLVAVHNLFISVLSFIRCNLCNALSTAIVIWSKSLHSTIC